MTRTFYINGESMVVVQGPAGSLIAGPSQLGLSPEPIQVTISEFSKPLIVDAYGQNNTVDEQVFGGEALINMTLVHFDAALLAECVRLSFPTASFEGNLGRAGARRGGGVLAAGVSPGAVGTAGNSLMAVNINSPVAGIPYNFPASFLHTQPIVFPFGTEKSIVRLMWKAIPYSIDPWNAGTGSLNVPIYNHAALIGAANPT